LNGDANVFVSFVLVRFKPTRGFPQFLNCYCLLLPFACVRPAGHRTLRPAVTSAVIVSRDSGFLDRIAICIFAFNDDSHVEWFEGDFQDEEKERCAGSGKTALLRADRRT
jgi:hypothetical protein